MRETLLSYGSQWFSFELVNLDDMFYEGWIDSIFTFVHK